jgi:glucose-6-phosphate isomerase
MSRVKGDTILCNNFNVIQDYSKNRVTDDVWKLLLQLAESRGLAKAREEMFSGAHINITEGKHSLILNNTCVTS